MTLLVTFFAQETVGKWLHDSAGSESHTEMVIE
jgi:hypothetical protein